MKILASRLQLVRRAFAISHGSPVQSLKREASFSQFVSKRAAMVEVPATWRHSNRLHTDIYPMLTIF